MKDVIQKRREELKKMEDKARQRPTLVKERRQAVVMYRSKGWDDLAEAEQACLAEHFPELANDAERAALANFKGV